MDSNLTIRKFILDRSETMQAKIRDAQMQKVPFMLIIWEKEEKENMVAVRTREGKDLGTMKLDKFVLEFNERSKVAGKILYIKRAYTGFEIKGY